MKPIDRGELLGIAEYEAIREHFRARVVAEKKLRRVSVGPAVTVIFESRDTVLMQIQEMIRTERITRPAGIEHELETYNELVPGDKELSCTMMIDVIDKVERDAFLRDVRGIQQHVALVIDGERIGARCPTKDDSGDERAVAVLYLKFSIPDRAAQALRAANAHATLPVELAIDHPNYAARVRLPRSTVAELAQDLDA